MAEINKELLEKAKQTNSPEELIEIAKENGITLSAETAVKCFDLLNRSGELSDDDLKNVSSGCHGYDSPHDRNFPVANSSSSVELNVKNFKTAACPHDYIQPGREDDKFFEESLHASIMREARDAARKR